MITRILAAGAAATALSAPAAQAQEPYEGETINLIINLSAGGSTGVMAQLFSQYWSEHIPGNPDFVVTPVTGGGQLRGIMEARDARPDGLTLAWVSWSAPTREIGPASQQVDWTDFDSIAGVATQPMAYMRNDVGDGVEMPEDIVDVEGVRLGGYRPGSFNDLSGRLSLDMLGVDYEYTTGFRGGSQIVAALQRGEVNMHVVPAANYFGSIRENVVEAGDGLPLWYYRLPNEEGELVSNERFGDIRTFADVYESIKGEPPSGVLWESMIWLNQGAATWFIAAPAGVDEEKLSILRESFMEASQDPEYLEEVEKITGLVPEVSGHAAMDRVIESLSEVDPEIVSTLQDYIETGTQ